MKPNIFENREASKFFSDCVESMNREQKTWFVREVKSLFNDKSISEEGEYDCFKVTTQDLKHLAECVVNCAHA